MDEQERIEKLRHALKGAAKIYGDIDPKIGALLSITALYNFAAPHIEDDDDLKPYDGLVTGLMHIAEGFSSDLLTPNKRPQEKQQPYLTMRTNAMAAAALDRLISKKVPVDEASMRVYQAMRGNSDFDLSSGQIKQLRKNLNKGKYNEIQTEMYLGFINGSASAEDLIKG